MSIETYLLYLGVLAAFFATPPDTSQLLIISNSLRHGLRKSMATVAGDLSANSIQMTLAAFGLTAIVAANANALWVVKWAGVAYLVWIGLSLMLSKPKAQTAQAAPRGKLFRQGFVTSSANPYAVVFFGALLPQFIDASLPVLPQLLILGITYLVVDGLILVLWGWTATRTLGRVKALTGVWINRVSGALMIGAAALLGLKDIERGGSEMSQITLLDGSIGQELVKRSGDRATPLWSTQVMIVHPKLVGEVHLQYFHAGATIATTNTYAVLRDRLVRVGLEDQFEALTETAVLSARRARAAHGAGRVAGSIGPLFASYRADVCPPPDEAAKMYADTVRLLRDQVDLLLIETVSSVQQAEGALRACKGQGVPVWLALSVNDEDGTKLRSGEDVAQIAPLVAAHQPDAVCINCSRPEAIGTALDILKTFGKPYGAYANGFTKISEGFLKDAPTVDALEQRTDLGPEQYAAFAMGWIAQGATIVGGCCEVGPDHIAELAKQITEAGHEIV